MYFAKKKFFFDPGFFFLEIGGFSKICHPIETRKSIKICPCTVHALAGWYVMTIWEGVLWEVETGAVGAGKARTA